MFTDLDFCDFSDPVLSVLVSNCFLVEVFLAVFGCGYCDLSANSSACGAFSFSSLKVFLNSCKFVVFYEMQIWSYNTLMVNWHIFLNRFTCFRICLNQNRLIIFFYLKKIINYLIFYYFRILTQVFRSRRTSSKYICILFGFY